MKKINPASFSSRVLATLLDGILVSILSIMIAKLLNFNESYTNTFEQIFKIGYILILPILWYGYTIGKRTLGIRIVKIDGANISFLNSLYRTMGSLFYLVPVFIGFILSFGTDISRYEEKLLGLLVENAHIPTAFVIGTTATALIFLTSVLMVAYRKDRRSIHDFIAHTYVTNEKHDKEK